MPLIGLLMPVFKVQQVNIYFMKRKNVFAAFGLLAIAAIMGIVSLSSFTGKGEAKVPEAKKFQTVVLFYDGSEWVEDDQGSNCNANGAFCRLEYNDATVNPSRTPADIAADAQALYAPTISNTPTSGTVQVANGNGGFVTVTIFEKAP